MSNAANMCNEGDCIGCKYQKPTYGLGRVVRAWSCTLLNDWVVQCREFDRVIEFLYFSRSKSFMNGVRKELARQEKEKLMERIIELENILKEGN